MGLINLDIDNSNSTVESAWLAQSKASSVGNGKQPRSCDFQQGNVLIRGSNQHGWLSPRLPGLGEVLTSILWFSARKCSNSKIESAWLAHSKASRLGALSNLDPVVFNKEMLQFEDRISMAGSFQSFIGCER